MTNNDALIEIAIELMKTKNKPQTIHSLAKEVFEIKGIKFNDKSEEYAQFEIDFMLCGDFIACGEIDGNKVWDLKNRQSHDKQDKEGYYIDNQYEENDEVKQNELTNDPYYYDDNNNNDNTDTEDDDEDDALDNKDDIEEELEDSDLDSDDEEEESERKGQYIDDDVEEDSYDDEDEN